MAKSTSPNVVTQPATFSIVGRLGEVGIRSGNSAKSNKPYAIKFAQVLTFGATFEVGFEDNQQGTDFFNSLRSGSDGLFSGYFINQQGTIRFRLTDYLPNPV